MAEESSSGERVDYVSPAASEKMEEGKRVLTPAQEECLAHIRKWVETEAGFYGRTDDEFLYAFLFSCKFNVEKIKKKMCKYYEVRRDLPQWWANRDLKDPELLALLQLKVSVVLKDQGPNHPTIYFTKLSRFTEALDTKRLDLWFKLSGVNAELVIRRMGAQMMGAHWLVDVYDVPMWLITRLLSPIFIRDLATSIVSATPLRVKSITAINSPPIIYYIWALARPFFPRKIRDRVHIYRSDWSKMYEHFDRDYLPEEYGGNAGPLALHEEDYINQFLSYTDYFPEDNQYGYQTED